MYDILFYYTVRVKIRSESYGFYGHDTTRQSRDLGNPAVATRPSVFLWECHNIVPAMFKMDQCVSFSTGGIAMGARLRPLADLLPTVGYTSYKHSTMKSL